MIYDYDIRRDACATELEGMSVNYRLATFHANYCTSFRERHFDAQHEMKSSIVAGIAAASNRTAYASYAEFI